MDGLGEEELRTQAFVHIGFPKTGSTSIQEGLFAARQPLLERGVLYPGPDSQHRALAARFHPLRTRFWHFANTGTDPEEALAACDRILAQVRDRPSHVRTVVLSTETLHRMSDERVTELRDTLEAAGCDLSMVCYLRHPFDQAVSWGQQVVGMGGRTLREIREEPRYMHAEPGLGPWLRVIGRDRMHVHAFEDAKRTGVGGHFLRCIGRPELVSLAPRLHMNPSLSLIGAWLSDAYHRRRRLEPDFALPLGHFWQIGGPRFALPRTAFEEIRKAAAEDCAWVHVHLGVTLPDYVPPADPPHISEAAADAMLDHMVHALGSRTPKRAWLKLRREWEARVTHPPGIDPDRAFIDPKVGRWTLRALLPKGRRP